MIAIIDYEMGNLRSVQKAFERVGHAATITSDPAVSRIPKDRAARRRRISRRDRRARRETRRANPRCHRRSKPFSASAWDCNCCSIRVSRTAVRRLGIVPGEVVRFKFHGIQSAAYGLESDPLSDGRQS
jgi:glutamine amidotransferase